MAKKPAHIYQIKVSLDNTHPPIWRRILVPGNITLLKLHDILQIVMGWESYHLHMYTIAGSIYGDPEDDEVGSMGTLNEASYKLDQVINQEGQRFSYEYDFGDGWEHTLLVEKIISPQEGVYYPLCLKGKRACPPEDVGGFWGYASFLEAIQDPTHDEHEDYLEWIGGEFDPEAFDLEEINNRLRGMGRGRSAEAQDDWHIEKIEETNVNPVFSWQENLPADQRAALENLPLRRDMIVLLTYLHDNKVTGTASTGNLPLKAVHEICARFVNPPALEDTAGENIYRVRSEIEVWPLYFRHVLASVGGLVTGGSSQRWTLTPLAERFLSAPAPIQVWLLLVTWWTEVNWVIASQIGYKDQYLLSGFTKLTLIHLLDLPVDALTPFEPFADRLIEAAKLSWSFTSVESEHIIPRAFVEQIVVDPLVDFGILEPAYEPHKILGEGYRQISAFRITPSGKGLLESIKEAVAVG